MYFVDREKIEITLQYIEQQIELFESKQSWTSPLEKAALERITHSIMEAILDVGNAMIDGFIMRDPGSYEDIIDILTDEKVITAEMSESFKILIPFRKMVVQHYVEVCHNELQSAYMAQLNAIKLFPSRVREYLVNELGPVSAFKN